MSRRAWSAARSSVLPVAVAVASTRAQALASCSDEKVANRDIRIWHLVIENGY